MRAHSIKHSAHSTKHNDCVTRLDELMSLANDRLVCTRLTCADALMARSHACSVE